MARNNHVTKADLYEAAEKFFPEHDIVFDCDPNNRGRRFTNCMVGERMVMRYCPPAYTFGWPENIIVFAKNGEPMDCITEDDLYTILANGIKMGEM